MPEGPECEVVARQLTSLFRRRNIIGGETLHDKFRRVSANNRTLPPLPLGSVSRVTRHGKWILLSVEDENVTRTVRINLGMSGRFVVCRRVLPDSVKRDHVRWIANLSDGLRLVYVDTRCMGHLRSEAHYVAAMIHSRLAKSNGIPDIGLGVDCMAPLFYYADYGDRFAAMRSVFNTDAPVKAALMNQSRIAGLGNIYAAEACFYMKVLPTRSASSLGDVHIERYLQNVPAILDASVAAGGTSFGDVNTFRDLKGVEGKNSKNLRVYGRENKPCFACGKPLSKTRENGRSTFFCKTCQE